MGPHFALACCQPLDRHVRNELGPMETDPLLVGEVNFEVLWPAPRGRLVPARRATAEFSADGSAFRRFPERPSRMGRASGLCWQPSAAGQSLERASFFGGRARGSRPPSLDTVTELETWKTAHGGRTERYESEGHDDSESSSSTNSSIGISEACQRHPG